MGLKKFIGECSRVFKVTRKPSKLEFFRVLKVTGAGVFIIGLIGFIVTIVYQLIFGV